MNIENLETFLNIARHQSFTKAADKCFCTQATASLRIKNLEDYYGIKLFDRIGKSVQLTTAGEILLPYVELIMSNYKETKDRINQLKHLSFGEVSIVSSHTPGTYILPDIICKFRDEHPKVKIDSQIQYSKEVINNLLFGYQYDFGFVSQPNPIEDEKLICQPILKDNLVVITNPSHRWAWKKSISLKDLTGETLVLSNKLTTLISYLSRIKNGRLNFDNQIVIGNIQSVKNAVMMGIGYSILSKFSVEEELASGKLKEIKVRNIRLSRTIYLLRRKSKILSPASDAFINLLLDGIKNAPQSRPGNAGQRLDQGG